jgi:hypothetical protein
MENNKLFFAFVVERFGFIFGWISSLFELEEIRIEFLNRN